MAKASNAMDDVLSRVGKEFGNAIKNGVQGKTVNGKMKAINHIGNNYLGGAEVANRVFRNKEKFGTAMRNTFMDGDNYRYGKIAGSIIGVSTAGRIVSGGGIYKDRNGTPNLIGVPFV